MIFFTSIETHVEQKIHVYASYVMTLYFFEILHLMFGLLFLYGKTVSIFAGVILSLLLSYHIIQFFFKKALHRKIQLYLIDVHAAYVFGYLFASAVAGTDPSAVTILILVIRSLTLALEFPLIFFLTRKGVADGFV